MDQIWLVFLDFQVVLAVFLGVFVGIVLSAIPGLTATMGIALLIPYTFSMPSVVGISMILAIYVGGMYGSSITAILIRTPGTPSSAATLLDGYPMAANGRASEALTWATIASFIGGLFSAIVLIFIAPQIASFALKFGPAEYFALAVFGLSIVGSVSGIFPIKGIIAGALGVLIGTIGLDPLAGTARFTFQSSNLMGGVEFIPALIGLFAVSQVIKEVSNSNKVKEIKKKVIYKKQKFKFKEIFKYSKSFSIASVIGTFIGIIPGAGSSIATFISYNEVKRFSKKERKKDFGTGIPEGIIASESANNAVTGGALVPLLTLGIPGDVITAVILGGLMIQGIQPGPMLFVENPSLVYSMFGSIILANIFMIILGLLGVRLFAKIVEVPKAVLLPIIIVLSFIGTYSLSNNMFDVWTALAFGVVGYLFEKYKYPLPPLILGLILGPLIESNMRRALTTSNQDWTIFLQKPISAVLLIIAFLTFVMPLITNAVKSFKKVKNN